MIILTTYDFVIFISKFKTVKFPLSNVLLIRIFTKYPRREYVSLKKKKNNRKNGFWGTQIKMEMVFFFSFFFLTKLKIR